MRGGSTCMLAAFLFCPLIAQAAVIDVTLVVDKDTIAVGEIATLSVYAQVKPGSAIAANGVFGWDVDLRNSDAAVIGLLSASLDRSGWTGNAFTSSSGTATSWGIDAIYDTGETDNSLGLSSPVMLFSIQIQGLTEGTATFSVEPDATSGADFVTWKTGIGGDYSLASVGITVVPEPSTALLILLSIAAVRRRRHA